MKKIILLMFIVSSIIFAQDKIVLFDSVARNNIKEIDTYVKKGWQVKTVTSIYGCPEWLVVVFTDGKNDK